MSLGTGRASFNNIFSPIFFASHDGQLITPVSRYIGRPRFIRTRITLTARGVRKLQNTPDNSSTLWRTDRSHMVGKSTAETTLYGRTTADQARKLVPLTPCILSRRAQSARDAF